MNFIKKLGQTGFSGIDKGSHSECRHFEPRLVPYDAHRPTIKADGYDVVKRIVIKIQTAKDRMNFIKKLGQARFSGIDNSSHSGCRHFEPRLVPSAVKPDGGGVRNPQPSIRIKNSIFLQQFETIQIESSVSV